MLAMFSSTVAKFVTLIRLLNTEAGLSPQSRPSGGPIESSEENAKNLRVTGAPTFRC